MKNPTKPIISVLFICLLFLSLASTVSAQSMTVRAEASTNQPKVGDTLTIKIQLSNAQNIYGVDVTLDWNPSVLKLVSATPELGVESNPGGVLHDSSQYPIDIINNDASQADGEYHLLATSTGSATAAFSGAGTIATVTFTVISTGDTKLAFPDVELSQRASDGTISLVNPQTTVDSVNPVASGSSISPTVSVNPITSSPTSNASPTVPEFPQISLIVILVIVATAAFAALTLRRKRPFVGHEGIGFT